MSSMGDLVTHLVANTVGFQQGFAKAQGIARSGVSAITSAIAPLTGALAAAFGAGSAISAFKEDLQAMRRLEAVLKATGGAAGFSAKEIGAYASELQKATNFGDEATVGAAAIVATFTNIRGDNFKRAIALSQDMATVLGVDLDTAAKKLGKSLKDIRPEDVGAKLSELEGRFGGAAAAVADPWTQLKNAIGDIGETIGGLLMPAVDAISVGLMDVASTGQETFAGLQQTVQEWVDGAVIAYGTLGESAFLFYQQTQLAVVQSAAEFQHFFTQVLPEYLNWFAENWQDVFFTAADYAATVFINLGSNIREAWQAVLDFFAGNPVEPNFKKLTEGAVNTIKALPDVPERLKSEFEKSLEDDIKTQQEHIARQQQEIADAIVGNRAEKEAARNAAPGGLPPEFAGKESHQDMKFGALQKGSADALSAVFKAMRGDDIQQKQLEVATQQLDQMTELNRNIEARGDASVGQWVLPA